MTAMAPVPSGRLKGNPGTTVPPSSLTFLQLAGRSGHLDIDDAVERTDLAVRDADRPDAGAARDDLGRLIGALDRIELPAEELSVEFPGPRKVGRGDVEPGDASRPDIRRRLFVGRTDFCGREGQGHDRRQDRVSRRATST
jgi:hypothetical protein